MGLIEHDAPTWLVYKGRLYGVRSEPASSLADDAWVERLESRPATTQGAVSRERNYREALERISNTRSIDVAQGIALSALSFNQPERH